MPTYDYRCNACGHEFELFQQMSAPVQRKCPECGKLKLQRLIGTGSAVLFKGGGFYETDYRSESYKKAAEAEKKPPESSADKKPDAGAKETAPKPDPAPAEKPEKKADPAASKSAAVKSTAPKKSKRARR
jgi:putative FmdB family regulatory protein